MQLRFATLVLVLLASQAFAQAPVDRAVEHVNQYNGNFQYTVPVMNVKGPNGELFPIIAAYTAGVGVDQEASWIGLGWDMNLGEIKRKLNGAPDDCNGEVVKQIEFNSSGGIDETYNNSVYGPLYYHNYNAINATEPTSVGNVTSTSSMDVYQSSFGLENKGSSFMYPDYDEFYVSAPGFSGSMQFHLFQYANLHTNPLDYDATDDVYWTYYPNDYTNQHQGTIGFYSNNHYKNFANWETTDPGSRPQLKMIAVDGTKVSYNRLADFSGVNSTCDPATVERFLQYPDACFTPPGSTSAPGYNTGDLVTNTKRVKGKYYIQYFTNAELSSPPADFIEASGFTSRATLASSRPKDIGAIQVTTPEGITYHYSLPVYTHGDTARTLVLNSDNQAANPMHNLQVITKPKHVSAWKLTAITNHLYEDRGTAGFDESDWGYWVEIRYNKWTGADDYTTTFPFFGYNIGLETDAFSSLDLKGYYGKFNFYKTYSRQGSNSTIETELYYPEYVKTAEQTAYFFKSVRRDAHSDFKVGGASLTAVSKLKLDRLVLVNTGDVDYSNVAADEQPTLPSTRLIQGQQILDTDDYTANKAQLDGKAIKQVVFDYSYKLAKGSYNNVTSTAGFGTADLTHYKGSNVRAFTEPITSAAVSTSLNSGKLTLDEIAFIDRENFAGTPPYTFEYSDRDGLNPRYDHLQKTAYGYHLNSTHVTSTYLKTSGSVGTRTTGKLRPSSFGTGNKEAWSLVTVNEPAGTAVDLTYEDDVIEFASGQNYIKTAVSEFFLLENVSISGGAVHYKFSDPTILTALQSLGTGTVELDIRIPADCGGTDKILVANGVSFIASTGGQDGMLALVDFQVWPSACSGSLTASSPINWNNDTGPAYVRIRFKEGVKSGGIRVKEIALRDKLTNRTYKARFSYNQGAAPNFPSSFRFSGNWTDPLAINTVSGDRHAPSSSIGYRSATVNRLAQDNTPMSAVKTTFVESYSPIRVSVEDEVYVKSNGSAPGYSAHRFEELRCSYAPGSEGRIEKKEYLDAEGHIQSYQKYIYNEVENSGMNEVFYSDMSNTGWGANPDDKQRVRSIYRKKIYVTTLAAIESYENESEVRETFASYDKTFLEPTSIVFNGGGLARTETRSFYPYHYTDTDPKQKIKFLQEREITNGSTMVNGTKSIVSNNSSVLRLDANGAFDWQSYNWRQNRKLEIERATETDRGNGYELEKVNTLYELNGKPLESYEVRNDRYSSVKYTQDDKVLCQAQGANYFSQTFSSFEQYYTWADVLTAYSQPLFDGGVVKGDAVRISDAAQVRSGNYSLSLPNNASNATHYSIEFDNEISLGALGASTTYREPSLLTNRTYKASVWVLNTSSSSCGIEMKLFNTSGGVIASAASNGSTFNINGWYKHEVVLQVPEAGATTYDRLEVKLVNQTGANVIVDDFMVMPNGSDLKGYVYNEEGLTEFEFNSENLRMKYEYDLAGRVLTTWMDTEVGLKKIKEKKYMLK